MGSIVGLSQSNGVFFYHLYMFFCRKVGVHTHSFLVEALFLTNICDSSFLNY